MRLCTTAAIALVQVLQTLTEARADVSRGVAGEVPRLRALSRTPLGMTRALRTPFPGMTGALREVPTLFLRVLTVQAGELADDARHATAEVGAAVRIAGGVVEGPVVAAADERPRAGGEAVGVD